MICEQAAKRGENAFAFIRHASRFIRHSLGVAHFLNLDHTKGDLL
jgi:hypothetical protein